MKITLLAAILVALWSTDLWAQACCSATSAGEAGVVDRCHKAMLQAGMTFDHGVASFNAQGDRETFEETQSEDIIFTVSGGIRPVESVRVGLLVPYHLQHRSAQALGSTQWALGDIAFSTGWLALEDPMLGLSHDPTPFLEFVLMGSIATGNATKTSEDPFGADITSTGSHSLGAGVRVIKFVVPSHALRLNADWLYKFSHDVELGRESFAVKPGSELRGVLGWAYEGSIFWSAGLFVRGSMHSEITTAGKIIDGSGMRRLTFGAHWRQSLAFPFWDINFSAGTDMFLGENLPRTGVSGGISVQRNFL